MEKHASTEFHPRDIELANVLKGQYLEWNVTAGDWFLTGTEIHVVLDIEEDKGEQILICQLEKRHKKDDVVFIPHLSDCQGILADKGWDLKIDDLPDGQFRATSHRLHTEMKVERVEPTDLSAAFAVMVEVINIFDFDGM